MGLGTHWDSPGVEPCEARLSKSGRRRLRHWIRREARQNASGNAIAAVAVVVSVLALAHSCISNEKASSIAQQGLDIAIDASRKADAATPDGAVLGPANRRLSSALCFRFFGYQYNIPGNARLWVVLQTLDDPSIYLFEVNPANSPLPRESEAAMGSRAGATAWVAAVQIGDPRRTEETKEYDVSLYYASTAQSVDLRGKLGGGVQNLPPDVEAQRLGQKVRYSHGHDAGLNPNCSLDKAVNG